MICGGVAIIVGGNADDGTQGLDHGVVIDLVVTLGALAEFHALCRLHDHILTCLYLQVTGIEIIGFTAVAKTDRCYDTHMATSFLQGKIFS